MGPKASSESRISSGAVLLTIKTSLGRRSSSGQASKGSVRIPLRPAVRQRVRLPDRHTSHEVALVGVWPGDDGRILGAAGDLGYDGLVVEGMGGGHVPPAAVGPLERLAARMPVVLASRTGGGETLASTYDASGSEMDLLARGLIPAGPLDGPKARVLLALLLRSGASREEVHAAFGHRPEGPQPGT